LSDQTLMTLSVPIAGKRYFDLGRNASYEAARRGELPVIRMGRLLRVPVVAVERMLSETRPRSSGAVSSASVRFPEALPDAGRHTGARAAGRGASETSRGPGS